MFVSEKTTSNEIKQEVRRRASGVPVEVNKLVFQTRAEKITAIQSAEYLKERGKNASEQSFLQVLDKVPD